MASSTSAFASAPAESPVRRSHFFMSSSPDFASIQELLSRRSEAPPFKASPRRSAGNLKTPAGTVSQQGLSAAIESRAGLQLPDEDRNTAIEIEDVSLMEIEADAFRKARDSRIKGLTEPKVSSTILQQVVPPSTSRQEPWKKFRLKDDSNTGVASQNLQGPPNGGEQSLGLHAGPGALQGEDRAWDEPLHLEPAMARRLDWTPPVKRNNQVIVVDSSSPALGDSGLSEKPSSRAREFEQLLNTYKCTETLRQDIPTTTSDDDSGFLKKRKLIEMFTSAPNSPALLVEKSLPQPKAAKKKARTITELATAAYKPASSPGVIDAAQPGDHGEEVTEKTKAGGSKKSSKMATKPRRQTVKKKSTLASKQVLLPPDEALREVAEQNFLYGTSSQLAVEKSPTSLRYLQTAMKDSEETEVLDLGAWRSSSAEGTPRRRPKLWEAGARDEDGDLFDVEMSNLAGRSFEKMSASQEKDDPFGYLQQGTERPVVVDLLDDRFVHSKLDDPFADTTDFLPDCGPVVLKGTECVGISTNDAPKKRKRDSSQGPSKPVDDLPSIRVFTLGQARSAAVIEAGGSRPERPLFESFTDAQLDKEIRRYGFKPVKLRKARIALLEQCWEGRSRASHPSVGVGSSASFATKARRGTQEHVSPATPEGKKRPGRPRKNSDSTPDPQEPPPSAQPRDSPVRPRGRPKKTTATKGKHTKTARTTKTTLTTKAKAKTKTTATRTKSKAASAAPATSTGETKAKRARTTTKTTVKVPLEIADSASDGSSDSASDSDSAVDNTGDGHGDGDGHSDSDSDSDSDSGVRRRQSRGREASFSPPLLDLVSAADEAGTQSSSVYSHVTRAVKSAPRTTDPSRPSWYEKMLLYDPIILEDLADWLNGGELRRVGYDGDVSVVEVKKWCESRSVCCLKRENLRGQQRKRY